MIYKCMSITARLNAGIAVDPITTHPERFYTLMAESINHVLKAKRQYSSGGWSNTISAIKEIVEEQVHRCYQAMSATSTDYVVQSYAVVPNFFKLQASKRQEKLVEVIFLFPFILNTLCWVLL